MERKRKIENLTKKNKNNILVASRSGSVNVKNVSQFLDLTEKEANDVLDRIFESGELDRKENLLPSGGFFYSFSINDSGKSWLKSNIPRKYKVLKVVNNDGPVASPSVASVIGSSFTYASNTLRRLWGEGLVSRESDKKHAYLYKISKNGIARLDWITGNNPE